MSAPSDTRTNVPDAKLANGRDGHGAPSAHNPESS
jgi:hypothetical protein